MIMGKKYKVFPLKATDKAELFDATAEELRLLIALIERGGDADEEALADAARITRGRCKASLRFWCDGGVISECADEQIVTEHPTRVIKGELIEESGVKVAADIRKNNLKPLFDELAGIFERPLTTGEAKIVSGVVEQYGVSTEYVVTLAAHLKGGRGFTVAKLRDRAISLTDKGIDEARIFKEDKSSIHCLNKPKLFYLWGHSYEFKDNKNWHLIEDFAKLAGGKDNVWYATNTEIYNYVTAFNNLQFSFPTSLLHSL